MLVRAQTEACLGEIERVPRRRPGPGQRDAVAACGLQAERRPELTEKSVALQPGSDDDALGDLLALRRREPPLRASALEGAERVAVELLRLAALVAELAQAAKERAEVMQSLARPRRDDEPARVHLEP